VIPLDWKGYQSSLIICLKENMPSDDAPATDFSLLDDDMAQAD
jgi:hypothetical protein